MMTSAEKRNFLIIFILALLLVISIFWFVFRDKTNINEFNNNLDIYGFKLLMKENELSRDFTGVGGCFGCHQYKNVNGDTVLAFSGYRDVLDHLVLTRIIITNESNTIYGIHVGMNREEGIAILKKFGFKIIDYEKRTNYIFLKRSKLSISLKQNEQLEITEIDIRIHSTNRRGVIY